MLESHGALRSAFLGIEDKNALAWSVLDTKSETAVTRAIALSANRMAGARVAHVEYPPRLDLVLVESGTPVMAYEAKAAYLTDFQPHRVARGDWYLGLCTDEDLGKLQGLASRFQSIRSLAGLFFIYEVNPTAKQLKYGGKPHVELEVAVEALTKGVKTGRLAARETIPCGDADGAKVAVHMFVFDLVVSP